MICWVWSEAQLNESRLYKFTYFYCMILTAWKIGFTPNLPSVNLVQKVQTIKGQIKSKDGKYRFCPKIYNPL